MLKRPKFAAQTLPLLFPNLANTPRTQKFMSLPAHLFSPPIPREQGLEAAVVAACAMNPPRAFWHVPCRGKLLLQGCRMARLHFGAWFPTLFVLGLQAPAIILSARHHPLKTVPFLHSSIIPCSLSGPTRGPALPGRTLQRQEKKNKKPKQNNENTQLKGKCANVPVLSFQLHPTSACRAAPLASFPPRYVKAKPDKVRRGSG